MSLSVPEPLRRTGESREGDLGVARDEIVEGLDAELLHLQPAARTGGIVRLAAPLGAIGQDRLQRRAIEPGHGQLGETHIDGLLVARMHDGGDGQAGSGNPWLTIADGNADQWVWTSRKSRMWPITSSVFWCTTQWSAPAISRTVRSSQ